MKFLKSMLLVLAAGLMMTACGGGEKPSDVVKKSFEATKTFDLAALKPYVANADTAQFSGVVAAFEAQIATLTDEQKVEFEAQKKEMEAVTFEIVNEEIVGDTTATVTVKVKHPTQGEQEQKIQFVKEDGKWKFASLTDAF